MDFKTFISRLEEVRDIGRIENGYSHIVYNVMYDHVLDSEKYMLVDVSTYRRTKNKKPINEEFLGKDLCAVPDFVITNKTTKLRKIQRLGCIEVKFHDKDVDVHLATENNSIRLSRKDDKKGYLEVYNHHVIYTNGWKWNYYDGSLEDDGKTYKALTFDFTKKDQQTEERYKELIKKLCNINWNISSKK